VTWLADEQAGCAKILSIIATHLAPECGIMNVFVSVWNSQRPVRQILVDEYLEKNSGGVDDHPYVGGFNKERDTI
jgi:hypothetical protein